MSLENVETVRSWHRAVNRTLSAYSANPGRIEDAPFIDDVFALADEDIEWSWPLTPESFRGREGLLQAASDFLEAMEGWQIELEETIDAGDRVFASLLVRGRGKGSGAPSDQHVYTVFTFRNGRILRIEDHLDRGVALEAAGLPE